ncbi:MAG: acetyltransferase [Christiangramia sp.]|nr:acetyltransferase [Christiangramia sp.]
MIRKELVLAGYSGHGMVVADTVAATGQTLKFYCDKNERAINPFKLHYLGFEGDRNFDWKEGYEFVLGIGDNSIRRRMGELITSHNLRCINIIHPSSHISKFSTMGSGNFISSGVHLNVHGVIGDFCILNTGSIIEHECILGDAVHIAPGAVLAGNVIVGNNSFIGANSVIKEGVRIGDNVVIGAGTVVISDINDNEKIVGNPGRKI